MNISSSPFGSGTEEELANFRVFPRFPSMCVLIHPTYLATRIKTLGYEPHPLLDVIPPNDVIPKISFLFYRNKNKPHDEVLGAAQFIKRVKVCKSM